MNTASAPPSQPLMPKEESETVRLAYEDANVILEYGCGGSTIMAAKMPGKTVFSVESDPEWVETMRNWLVDNPPAKGTSIDLNWVDIGPVREWGHPVNDEAWRQYPSYPLKIWDKGNFRQPDVVLVDGRFRVGCALATAFRTQKPITLLFDDYTNRKQYHRVENFIGKPDFAGRMAVFKVMPMPVPADRLLALMKFMTRP